MTRTIHASAAEGYRAVGAAYEAGRAGYPAEAVVFLLQRLGVIHTRASVVEVAAGTGKFTRALLAAGVRPTAVEPVAHMRETFAAATPGVEILDGTAESIPVDDAAADAVLAAQAFHWFDGPAALREFHRVTKPGGGLGLVWNEIDRSVGWVADVWREVDARRDDTPNAWSYAWKDAFTARCGYAPLEHAEFGHDHATSREGLIARVGSVSFIARAGAGEIGALADHVRRVCDAHALPEQFVLPNICHVYWCRRI